MAQRALSRAAVSALAAALDAGAVPAPGVYACPADFGATDLAVFGYPTSRQVTVSIALTGCRLATNGRRTAWATDLAVRLLARAGGPRTSTANPRPDTGQPGTG